MTVVWFIFTVGSRNKPGVVEVQEEEPSCESNTHTHVHTHTHTQFLRKYIKFLFLLFLLVGGQTAEENEIIKLTQQLINSIADKHYKEYV